MPRREELSAFLESCGIQVRIQHPIFMPEQPIYRHCPGHYPNARKIVTEILCLPSTEEVSLDDVEYVCDCIRDFYTA